MANLMIKKYDIGELNHDNINCLELGCGLGLAAIALGKLLLLNDKNFMFKLLLTDGDDEVIELCKKNIASNCGIFPDDSRSSIVAQKLFFGNLEDEKGALEFHGGKAFDLILAADVLYEISGNGTIIILQNPSVMFL